VFGSRLACLEAFSDAKGRMSYFLIRLGFVWGQSIFQAYLEQIKKSEENKWTDRELHKQPMMRR